MAVEGDSPTLFCITAAVMVLAGLLEYFFTRLYRTRILFLERQKSPRLPKLRHSSKHHPQHILSKEHGHDLISNRNAVHDSLNNNPSPFPPPFLPRKPGISLVWCGRQSMPEASGKDCSGDREKDETDHDEWLREEMNVGPECDNQRRLRIVN